MIVAESTTEPKDTKTGGQSLTQPKIGVALGAGGAKGIAHIPMLEAFDELGITPHRIAGSSIGAVIGALYASGRSAAEIKEMVAHLAITKQDTFRGVLSDKKIGKWMKMIDPDFSHSGLLKTESMMTGLCQNRQWSTFEELSIPLMVVATDFHRHRSVVLGTGQVQPAVEASMAMPGVFNPVEIDGRLLIDGATTNPVPYDLLFDSCDVVVAVDINSGSSADEESKPGYFDIVFGSVQILQQAIVELGIEARPPDLCVRPELSGVRTLEFYKADEIYRQAQPAKEELKRRLVGILGSKE